MFDGPPPSYLGLAMANNAAARAYARNAQEWQDHAEQLEAQVQELKRKLAIETSRAGVHNAQMAVLEQEVAGCKKLRSLENLRLAVERAHADGLRAQLAAFIAAHPTSPVCADSGKRFKKDGSIKSKGRLIYEAAFDRVARENGIAVPTNYRTD